MAECFEPLNGCGFSAVGLQRVNNFGKLKATFLSVEAWVEGKLDSRSFFF